ncbi:MAG: transposase [Holdemanella porci]
MIQETKEGKAKMANKKKQFDQEFKQNAVNYCLTHPELSRKECAKNLGIGDSTLYRWKQEAKANNNQATFKGSGNLTEAELENRRLKRELKDTQDALEILKKPSAFWENNTSSCTVLFPKSLRSTKNFSVTE